MRLLHYFLLAFVSFIRSSPVPQTEALFDLPPNSDQPPHATLGQTLGDTARLGKNTIILTGHQIKKGAHAVGRGFQTLVRR